MATLEQWAYAVRDKYLSQVVSILGLTDPGQIKIRISNSLGMDTPAFTSGTTITLSAAYFKAHPEDKGAIVHEVVHAVLGDRFTGPEWLGEGIADYVRDKVKGDLGSSAGAGTDVRSGYQEGAAFLQWLEKVSPNVVQDLVGQATTPGQEFDKTQLTAAIQAYRQGTTPQEARANVLSNYVAPGPGGGWVAGMSGTGSTAGGGDVAPGTIDHEPTPAELASIKGTGFKYVDNGDGTWSPVYSNGAKDEKAKIAAANAAASFHAMIQQTGLALTPELKSLVQNGVASGWNSDRFLNHLYQTQDFQEAFPGIFAADGSLKMTPAAYLQNKQAYQDIGSATGIDVGDKKLAYLFNHNQSPAEFQDRATSISRLRDNPDLLAALNQQRGVDGLPQLSEHELFKGIMGEGNKEFYQGWQSAVTRYQSEQAGLKIGEVGRPGQYNHLGEGQLNKINSKGLSEADLSQGFQQLASDFLTALPASRIAHYGLTKGEIERAVFGGKNQAAIRQKMEHIMAQEKASEENTLAASQSYVGQGGRLGVQTGGGSRGATE